MGMGVVFRGLAMGGPAGVADADPALQGLVLQAQLQIAQLALSAAAGEAPILQRGDACRIIAPIFEPLQRLDNLARHSFTPENADNAAHVILRSGGR